MSCRELERLFLAGAPEDDAAAHRAACTECARLGSDLDRIALSASDLRPPAWSPDLRRELLDIPRRNVSCEGASELIAARLEAEIASDDESRLRRHLARCGGCSEAAATLAEMRSLAAPAPPPWFTAKLAAAKPARKKSFLRSAFSGRMVVAYAYAAAVLVMILGLNPTAVVRRAGFANLGESTRSVVVVAESSIGDRLGALQERALRTLAVWRGHVGGYGRAAVSNAIAIVWKPESKKSSTRPRLGKEGGAASPGEFRLAGCGSTEPFPGRFRV
jgi:hypothetical protein